MLRRSSRLESMGHYDSEGRPLISYRETLYRIFIRRRINRNCHTFGRKTIIISDSGNSISISESNRISNSKSRSPIMFGLKTFGYLFLMLYLCFGFANFKDSGLSESPVSPPVIDTDSAAQFQEMAHHLREMHTELQRLKIKISYLLSPVHTLPNYALESQGASLMFHLSSTTYTIEQTGLIFFGIPIWRPSVNPRTVIQAHSHLVPGSCWAFAGGQGHLVIALSHPVTITHVTLGHISKSLSPTGSIASAPKEFSVYGMKTLADEGTQLGTFLYDEDGDQLQLFKLPDHKQSIYNFVKLQIQSNWGHPKHTCLYSFKVHGELAG